MMPVKQETEKVVSLTSARPTADQAVVPINKPITRLTPPSQVKSIDQLFPSTDLLSLQGQWEQATTAKRARATQRMRLLRPILALMDKGVRRTPAVCNQIAHIKIGDMPQDILDIAKSFATRGGVCPGKATFLEWLKNYDEYGLTGLLDGYTGRVRQSYDWDLPCLQLYHIPSKPGFADVAFQLKQHGYNATPALVRSFINSLPSEYGPRSPWRMGQSYYRQNLGRYISMDHSTLAIGEMYQGDGHTCDAYIEHPISSGIWRAELTIWIDVRSHYLAGWYLSKVESGETTLYALALALANENHMPDSLHIDNGAGFVNRLMSDESTGYYKRMGMKPTKALPGNSKGKGLVEHWFRTFRDRHDKFWNGGKDYCGNDQAAETNRRINDQIKQGKRKLKTFSQYRDSVEQFVEAYNNTPQDSLGKKSPAEVWKDIKRNPPELSLAVMMRPSEPRVVQRCAVQLHNRLYENMALRSYNDSKVGVEYDFKDESKVWVYDSKDRLICIAQLKTKKAFTHDSIAEDRKATRERDRLKRIQRHRDEAQAQEANAFTHDEQIEVLEEYEAQYIPAPTTNHIELDITDEDY